MGVVGWLALGTASADEPKFSPARFLPTGAAGRAALLGPEVVDPAAIARAVAKSGFYADEPLSANDCAGCHAEIAAQWGKSAHRFSSFNNPYYAAAVDLFRVERPHPVARFCAGCHDPLLLVDDAIAKPQLTRDGLAAQAGLPCIVCHSISEDKTQAHRGIFGNGAYTLRLSPVPPPAGESAVAPGPSAHTTRLHAPLLGRPELCATCHRVALLPEVTHDKWLRGQDDYGPWLQSVAAGNGVNAVYRPDKVEVKRCQDCHMPLEPLRSGRLVRSHRFLGANAALANLRDDKDALGRVSDFLRGAVSLDVLVSPDFSTKATPDARLPLLDEVIAVPRRAALHFDVVLRNRRVGHRFPGGTNDSNEVFIEVEIAAPGKDGALIDDTHLVRAQPVDDKAQPLLRRDPQNMRGVVYNTSLSPADPQVVRYVADLESFAAAEHAPSLTLVARLRYRKFSRDYAAFACASLPATADAAVRARCLEPPVIDIAVARRKLVFAPVPEKDKKLAESDLPVWQRYLDHGLGLADGIVDEASAARPSILHAIALAKDRPEPYLGLARLALALGITDEVMSAGARAESLRKDHPAHLYLRGLALYRTYRFAEARPFFERAALLLPGDPNVLAMLARVRGLAGDPAAARSAAERLLVVEPESEDGHHQRMLALRELGLFALADGAEQRFLTYRRPVETDQELRQLYRSKNPERAQEDALSHTHVLRLVKASAGLSDILAPPRHP